MSIQIAIHTEHAFQEQILPNMNNANHSIVLNRSYFALKQPCTLALEVTDATWRLLPSPEYQVLEIENSTGDLTLEDKAMFRLSTNDFETIVIFVLEQDEFLAPYKKYSLAGHEKVTLGREAGNDISFNNNNTVSGFHAAIVRYDNKYVAENKSPNGLYVNEERVLGSRELNFGDYINIMGLHLVFLGDALAVDTRFYNVKIKLEQIPNEHFKADEKASASAQQDVKVLIHRSPRSLAALQEGTIEIEEPPAQPQDQKQPLLLTIGPSFTMALPMLLGCLLMIYASRVSGSNMGIFMYSGLVMALSSAMIGVMWTLVNLRHQKKVERENKNHRFEAYRRYLIEKTEQIKTVYKENEEALELLYPEAAACATYQYDSPLLWNRNVSHKDFLSYRLGLGDVDFQMRIDIPKERFTLDEDSLRDKPKFIKENYETLYHVPVTIDLSEQRMVGLVGGVDKQGAIELTRLLVAQMAAGNCYTDLKMAFLYNRDDALRANVWSFAKWLPHVWSEDKKTRYIASNKEEAGDVCYELAKVFRKREEEGSGPGKAAPHPHFIVFISDLQLIENELVSKYLLDIKEEYGVSVVILTDSYENLPNHCTFVVENTSDFRGTYDASVGDSSRREIELDQIDESTLETFARRLSNVAVKETEEGGEIPPVLTFFDMYGAYQLEDFNVKDRWIKSRTYEHIAGMLGAKAGDTPCYLDVHERYHGPHGLVAGTTGSGKSETLQTYLLSLAVNYSPDDVGFFIIDYKGGGMANLFNGLPHLVGQISNLSGNQVNRAMVSIKSENRRRQRIFNESGVNNINAYTKLYKDKEVSEPVPHLFIVIDEFAELKKEEPEFMRELISVAQVGRSLGVHLILATQKPAGTVDDNIWSNSKFRLCLRVQDRQDSMDMLHKADAAYITQAGRGYLQVGNDEVYELFQSGWSGAVYDPNGDGGKAAVVSLLDLSGRENPDSKKRQKKSNKTPRQEEKTQLEAVRDYLGVLAAEEGYAKQHALWLPVLPEQMYLKDFKAYQAKRFDDGWKEVVGDWQLDVVTGMVDDPQNQAQFPLMVSYPACGNIAVIGSNGSGKSTFIQSFLFSLFTSYSPEYVNAYILDFSSKMMSAFEGLAHVGGVMYDEDTETIQRFFSMLAQMVEERKKAFRGGNFAQYLKANGNKYPAVVLAIDNFAGFNEKTEQKYYDFLINLSKEGGSLGIFLLLTANAVGINDLPVRMADNMSSVYTLQLGDKFDYADVLHTIQLDVLPEVGVKGRGLVNQGGRVLEYQTALALPAEDDYGKAEAIRAICVEMNEHWRGAVARAVPSIPEHPDWVGLRKLPQTEELLVKPNMLPVGYNDENAEVYALNLRDFYTYLVIGAARTGKRNFLKIVALSALEKGVDVCVIDLDNAGFTRFAAEHDITLLTDKDQLLSYCETTLQPVFVERNKKKNELIREGMEEDELFETMSEFPPRIVLISDLESFMDTIYKSEGGMSGFFENIFEKGRLHNIYFIAAMNAQSRSTLSTYNAFRAFSADQNGIHFGGNVAGGLLNFDYISFKEQTRAVRADIGMLPEKDGMHAVERVVIPQEKTRAEKQK